MRWRPKIEKTLETRGSPLVAMIKPWPLAFHRRKRGNPKPEDGLGAPGALETDGLRASDGCFMLHGDGMRK